MSNEKLSFNELNEFEDFKEKIRLNSDLLDFLSKESESDINIKSTSLQLSECNRKLNEQCDELSYRYAHLAILAQEKGLKAATTSYLSKAIDWNPQHIHALLHERAERKNDIEALKAMTPVILSEKIKKYKKIIASEKNSSERIKLLKEAITEINSTETKPNTTEHNNKELQVNNYCKDLENLYYNDQEQQYIHKYKKLADFYYETRNLQEKSTKFYLISLELLDKSVNNENHKSIREEIIPKINLLSEKHIIDNIKIEAKEIANFIIHENEDKETKEIINQLYKEVLDLKNKENYRDEFYGSLLDTLFSLNISIDKQIIQNINSNSKIKLGNNNNEKINDIIEEFKSHISILPKKDLEFRNSIESTIESSLTDLISQFEKFSDIPDEVQSNIEKTEQHLLKIIKEEKINLQQANSDLSLKIKELSFDNIKIEKLKTDIINHLKSSEKKMIMRIDQMSKNNHHKKLAIQIIQDSIYQLHKTVKTIHISKNLSNSNQIDVIRNEIKFIISTCNDLESKVLEKLEIYSNYGNDIDSIKLSQNLFEKILLPKTIEALSNRTCEDTDIKTIKDSQNHLLERDNLFKNNNAIKSQFTPNKKSLLIIYLSIIFLSIAYFFVNHGLLDLLTNLWHTAWQKFNG